MKLRTSYFNPTAFRKDITRFAPSWALYTVFLLLVVLPMSDSTWFASNLVECIALFAVLNCLYAFLNVLLLFGDLFNTRMCNALHALPLRREGWFLTHAAAGMVFSLVPNLLVCCVVMPLLGKLFFIAPLIVLAATLQYVFFFGLAVFSAMCVGNRFAMALVYGILNFLSLLVYWFLDTLYFPLLPGVVLSVSPLLLLCPVVQASGQTYIRIDSEYLYNGKIETMVSTFKGLNGESWLYISVCALVGLALLALALVLYRRRKLEAAGDFLAVKPAEPVFLVLYSLAAGAVLELCRSLFTGSEFSLFLPIGVVIGFFTGRMLLKRTVRVFQPKAFLGLVCLVAALGITLGLTWLDPAGITRWVPEPEQVSAVMINPFSSANFVDNCDLTLTAPEDIETVTELHRQILENTEDTGSRYHASVTLRYILKSGAVRERAYMIPTESAPGQTLRYLLSSPECVFGTGDKEEFLDSITGAEFGLSAIYDQEELLQLADALWQDAEDGNLAQDWGFYRSEKDTYVDWLALYLKSGKTVSLNLHLHAENTLDWLYENGCFLPADYGLNADAWK